MAKSPSAYIGGLFETHLHVADLKRSMAFYGNALGLELAREETTRRVAFYWVGGTSHAMLGVWEKPPWATYSSETISPQHFAFEVSLEELPALIEDLKQQKIELRDFFDRVTDEPSVFGWMPAASIYCSDPDGHLLEFIMKLDGEPMPELGVVPLTEWKRIAGLSTRKKT